jgi:hypothetical protein
VISLQGVEWLRRAKLRLKASLKPTLRTKYYRLAGFVNALMCFYLVRRGIGLSAARKSLQLQVRMVAWMLPPTVLVNRCAVSALAWFKSEFLHCATLYM